MSDQLFYSLPHSCKSTLNYEAKDSIKLANNQTVQIEGTAHVKMSCQGEKHSVLVYILKQTSHPFILGTSYLIENKILLDFGNMEVFQKIASVRCTKRITLPPNSEMLVLGKLPQNILHGYQGFCENNKQVLSRGILVCKCLVTVSSNRTVPVKLLNPGNDTVIIPKGKIIAQFNQVTKDYDIQRIKPHELQNHFVNNVDLIDSHDDLHSTDNMTPEFQKFTSYFDVSENLNTQQNSEMLQFLYKNRDIFVTEENPSLGCTNIVQHHIILKPDFKPLHQAPYRLSPDKREILRHHLDELLEQGVICEVDATEEAPITSPIVLIAKRTKPSENETRKSDRATSLRQFRFVVDYRYLNSQCEIFKYNIPNILELTESFTTRVPNFISSIDMSSGFFQMTLSPDSSKYTAFNTCYGTFKFLRVPMGLHTSPNSFQLLMDKILRGLTFRSCLCYLDDVLIFSETYEQHLSDLNEIFDRFRKAGLKLNPQKCSFAKSSCIYLGHHISKDGIKPPPNRVNALMNYPPPKNIKQLRRILGMFNWFKKYIPNYSIVVEPLTRLLRKHVKFQWSDEQEQAFKQLKNLLKNSEVLAFPRFDLPFYLAVDSSAKGIGYILYQKHLENSDENIRVIRFGSKALTSWQKSYGPTKLELLGVVTSIVENSSYLRSNKFILECDHQALRPLFQNKFKGAIYDRWLAVLQQYNFEIRYKPAAQMQVPDALSRYPDTTFVENRADDSPDENDPYFPYMEEVAGNIVFRQGEKTQFLTAPPDQINSASLQEDYNDGYFADTEYDGNDSISVQNDEKVPENSPCFTQPLLVDISESNGNDSISVNSTHNFEPLCNTCLPEENEDISCSEDMTSTDGIFANFKESKETTLFIKEFMSEEGIDSSSFIPVGQNECTLKSSLSADMKMFDPLETKGDIQQFDSTSNVDILHKFESETLTPNDIKSPLDEHFTCNASILSPVQVLNQCSSQKENETEKEGIDSSSAHSVANETLLDKILCAIDAQLPDHDIDKSLNFNRDNIQSSQRNDDTLLPIISYLENGTLPRLQKDARRLLLTAPDYCLNNGLLYHSRATKSKRTQKMTAFQLVLPQNLIGKILKVYHESPLAGHMGIQQTIDNISENFYFPRLSSIISDFVRSCPDCQERKMTKAHTKSGIISYKTPTEPFQVWQMDLFGPLPITQKGNIYVFTAIDMFSKFLFTVPLPNCDSITVSHALFQLVCNFGVCNTVISDKGSEFISTCTKELCKLLQIFQNFTPSFIHHCLGLCERTHRTLAERLTPYFKKDKQWDDMLQAITFSFNVSPNASTKYSPYEVLYGFRPKFPLCDMSDNFKTIPAEFESYVNELSRKLTVIREEVATNAIKAGKLMEQRENKKTNPLTLSVGDYVYMLIDQTGKGRKLQPKYAGPYVVDKLNSPHLVTLREKSTGKLFRNPVHLDRLKIAYIRAPNPTNFYIPKTVTNEGNHVTDSSDSDIEPLDRNSDAVTKQGVDSSSHAPAVNTRTKAGSRQGADSSSTAPVENTRPKRQIRKPARFQSGYDSTQSETDNNYYKIKRVLGRRNREDPEYLVQFKGEPAQNALWTKFNQLNPQAQKCVLDKAPPFID